MAYRRKRIAFSGWCVIAITLWVVIARSGETPVCRTIGDVGAAAASAVARLQGEWYSSEPTQHSPPPFHIRGNKIWFNYVGCRWLPFTVVQNKMLPDDQKLEITIRLHRLQRAVGCRHDPVMMFTLESQHPASSVPSPCVASIKFYHSLRQWKSDDKIVGTPYGCAMGSKLSFPGFPTQNQLQSINAVTLAPAQ